jgi:hypothetical protein
MPHPPDKVRRALTQPALIAQMQSTAGLYPAPA